MSFASAMAASVVAKMLNDPAVFRKWPHYNQVRLSSSKSEIESQTGIIPLKKQETRVKRKSTVFRDVRQRSPSSRGSVDYHLASAVDSQSSSKENHGKRPIHPLGTTIPKSQGQNAAFPKTDREISNVVKFLKKEYNRRADFSPLLWSKHMKLQLKEVYTKLRVVSKGEAEGSEIDVDDIFGSSEEDNDPVVLVEGSPGIGKTTFCLKLAHDWANGAMPRNFPSFKLVFLLKCRDIIKDVVEEIFEQLLPEDRKEKTKEALDNFLEDLNNQKQTLIILDGLDELPDKSEDHVNKVLGRKKLSFCYVLATTRQEKGIYTREQFKFNICLVIEGFSEENSIQYIRKHFRSIGGKHSSKGERLIQEIKGNRLLRHLQSNPLNLLLLCVVYEDHEGSLPSSFTGLYQTIVRCLLRRYCAREELKASEKDEDLDKQFEITILALGELAWKCLLNDRLSFYEDELEVLERSNENIVARRLGLVYKEESFKRLKPRHAYSFLHKTFQEYLAASHIAHKFRGSEFQMLKELRFPEIVRGKFKQVFVFVCGILGEEANIVFEQIGNMLQKQWDWSKCHISTAIFFVDKLERNWKR
ncbi:NLR family CARD domain-containing protein 4-like isoform X2 [Acropora palmata]